MLDFLHLEAVYSPVASLGTSGTLSTRVIYQLYLVTIGKHEIRNDLCEIRTDLYEQGDALDGTVGLSFTTATFFWGTCLN